MVSRHLLWSYTDVTRTTQERGGVELHLKRRLKWLGCSVLSYLCRRTTASCLSKYRLDNSIPTTKQGQLCGQMPQQTLEYITTDLHTRTGRLAYVAIGGNTTGEDTDELKRLDE